MTFPTFRPRKSALGMLEDATGHESAHEGRIGCLGGGVELSFGVLAVCLPLVVVATVRKRPGIAAIWMKAGPATRTEVLHPCLISETLFFMFTSHVILN